MKKHGKIHKIFADYLVFSKDREIFKVHFYKKNYLALTYRAFSFDCKYFTGAIKLVET